MTIDARLAFVPASPLLWSPHLWPDGTRARLCETNGGDLGPAVVIAQLLVLDRAVYKAGGRLYIGQLWRSWEGQQAAYDSGRSQVGPGLSTHQSGHGADMVWPGITDEQFAAIATGLGWATIPNDLPHWEWHGIWSRLRESQGPEQMAMAMCFDFGLKAGQTYEGRPGFGSDEVGATQAGLWRGGENPGAIDGFPGPQTMAALDRLELKSTAGYRDLWRLRSVA